MAIPTNGVVRIGQVDPDDLIRDEPLARIAAGRITAELDSLHHRATAARVAEVLDQATNGLNIALFGPWGSGKTSFYDLVEEELAEGKSKPLVVRFDAWANAGAGFRANFLRVLAARIGVDGSEAADYFKSKKTVSFPPLRKLWKRPEVRHLVYWIVGLFVLVSLGGPALLGWAFHSDARTVEIWFEGYGRDLAGWVQAIAAPALVVLLISLIIDVARVTVDEAAPSESTEFATIFGQLIGLAKRRVVVFVDELDRCSPQDVMMTLEGLRTFLTDDRCAFLVAFDREAVAKAIARKVKVEVPERLDRPYYATAGEYLDKIFQFQVSLPPKMPQAYRRYSASLVSTKGGLWAQIRAIEPGALDRVVAVLAPNHLASPRRAKILLNDFAVSVRILESMGFDWISRREEIAALTVIQTEFPGFAANMQRVPGLPSFVLGIRTPRTDMAKQLTNHYAAPKELPFIEGPPIDEVTAQDPYVENVEKPRAQENRTNDRVGAALLINLRRYLRRLSDFNVVLPRADLVLMHDGDGLTSFEDSEMYSAVLLAADTPPEETLELLSSATDGDKTRAVRYLLELIEGEDLTTKVVLLDVAARLAQDLPNIAPLATDIAAAVAFTESPNTKDLAPLSTEAAAGVAAALVLAGQAARSKAFLDLARKSKAIRTAEVIASAVNVVGEPTPTQIRTDLKIRARLWVRADPSILATFIVRQDRWTTARLDDNDVSGVAAALLPSHPVDVEPTAVTVAARQEAAEANEAAKAEFETQDAAAANSAQALLDAVAREEISPESAEWVVKTFAQFAVEREWGESLLKAALERFAGDIEPGRRNRIALKSLMEDIDGSAFWVGVMDGEPIDAEAVGAPMAALVARVLEPGQGDEEREAAAVGAKGLARLAVRGGMGEAVVKEISELVQKRVAEFDAGLPARVATLNAAAWVDAELSDALAEFILAHSTSATVVGEVQALQVAVSTIEPLAASRSSKLLAASEPTTSDAEVAAQTVRLAFSLNATASKGHEPTTQVPSAQIAIAEGASGFDGLVRDWILAGADVDSVLNVPSARPVFLSDAGLAGKLSARSNPAERAIVWDEAVEFDAGESVMKAIARGGIPADRYVNSVADFGAASSPEDRAAAYEVLRVLDFSDSDTRKAILGAIVAASKHRRDQDLRYAATLLRAGAGFVTDGEKQRIRSAIQPWVEAKPTVLSGAALKDLRAQRFLPARQSWFDRVVRGEKKE
jgi:hypothetical protein